MSFMSPRGRARFSKASRPLTPEIDALGMGANQSQLNGDIIMPKYPVLPNQTGTSPFLGRAVFSSFLTELQAETHTCTKRDAGQISIRGGKGDIVRVIIDVNRRL